MNIDEIIKGLRGTISKFPINRNTRDFIADELEKKEKQKKEIEKLKSEISSQKNQIGLQQQKINELSIELTNYKNHNPGIFTETIENITNKTGRIRL